MPTKPKRKFQTILSALFAVIITLSSGEKIELKDAKWYRVDREEAGMGKPDYFHYVVGIKENHHYGNYNVVADFPVDKVSSIEVRE